MVSGARRGWRPASSRNCRIWLTQYRVQAATGYGIWKGKSAPIHVFADQHQVPFKLNVILLRIAQAYVRLILRISQAYVYAHARVYVHALCAHEAFIRAYITRVSTKKSTDTSTSTCTSTQTNPRTYMYAALHTHARTLTHTHAPRSLAYAHARWRAHAREPVNERAHGPGDA